MIKYRVTFLVAALLLTFSLLAAPQRITFAATLSAGGAVELVSAINTANSTPEADTILLTNDIVLTSPFETSAGGNTGLPPITSNITIEGQNHIINRFEAAPDFRILRVASGATLTLINVTISGGKVSTGTSSGGGIFNGGTLNVIHSKILNNGSTNGGGIINSGGVATITNSTISGNLTYTPNSLAPGGGGISNASGTLTVESSLISDNTTTVNGAGILSTSGTVTIHNTTIDGNTNAADGGGIYANGATLTASSSTILNNQAGNGGGLYVASGNVTVSNSTLTNNTAINGAGLDNNGSLSLINSTVVGNVGANANGFINFGTLTVKNSIVARLSATGNTCSNNGTLNSDTFTLTDHLSCSSFINSASLNLAALADNGGPTQTFNALSGSSAYDSADNTACEASPVNDLDQRGVKRGWNNVGQPNAPQPGDCDVGAFEAGLITRTLQFAAPFTVISPSATTVPVTLALDDPLNTLYAPVTAYIWVSGGTAVAGTDYAPFGVQTVTFNPGEETKDLTVNLLHPLTGDQTMILGFATQYGPGFNGAARLGTQRTHTLTLQPIIVPTAVPTSLPNIAPPRNLYTIATPTLTWNAVSGAIGYVVEVANNPAFTAATSYQTNLLSVASDPLANGTYYWRVRANQANGSLGAWSAAQSFIVRLP